MLNMAVCFRNFLKSDLCIRTVSYSEQVTFYKVLGVSRIGGRFSLSEEMCTADEFLLKRRGQKKYSCSAFVIKNIVVYKKYT